MANAVIAGTVIAAPLSLATITSKVPGQQLYEFVNTGSGPLPWSALSFESAINNTTMLGGPHSINADGASAIAYRTASNQIGLYVQNANAQNVWSNVSTQVAAPLAQNDPIPFFDPSGEVGILYVGANNHLILLSHSYSKGPRGANAANSVPAYRVTDLSLISGQLAANSVPSIQMNSLSGLVVFRSATNHMDAINLSWTSGNSVPTLNGPLSDVTLSTASAATIVDPVALATLSPSFVTLDVAGQLQLFSQTSGAWSAQNISALVSAPVLSGTISTTSSANMLYVGALSTSGKVELFSEQTTTVTAFAKNAYATTVTPSQSPWSLLNVTSSAPNAPPLTGSLYMGVLASQITIAGEAQNWGDLFVFNNIVGSPSWSTTDVSVTAGSAARTVGPVIAGITIGSVLDLFAAGIDSPPRQGVGLYAIPSANYASAITSNWPILSVTGGLGTLKAPWVGFTSAKSVATSPDYILGQAIYNSHKRVTWLTFWTVSGPTGSEPVVPATYYSHGFAAGAWVATQIAAYRNLGLGLKPDWVIFDPEGWPDNHSGLDAPSGATPAVLAKYATYWSAMNKGWADGLTSIDPTLNPGVYASQSEYRNYGLSSSNLPVFEAVAFSASGTKPPIQINGATGSNVRGYIAFSAVCTPSSVLHSEIATFTTPPWLGQFNTLQFNAGVYCPPA